MRSIGRAPAAIVERNMEFGCEAKRFVEVPGGPLVLAVAVKEVAAIIGFVVILAKHI